MRGSLAADSRREEIGRRMVVAAGLIPCAAGLAMLALSLWSATLGYHAGWLSLMGRHRFSAAQIAARDPGMWALWLLEFHLCGVNLAISGASIAVLAWQGLPHGPRWISAWIWVLLLWVGGNDAAALVRYRLAVGEGVPIALLPLTLGAAGLLLSGKQGYARR